MEDFEGACLREVLTIGEVIAGWGKARNTVIMAILRGTLIARQPSGVKGIYLVSKQSVMSLWGQPKKELELN